MLINWQPVLGRGTSKTAGLPDKEQVASQRLNMLLWLQLEINLDTQAFFFTTMKICPLQHITTIMQAWTLCFMAWTCPFLFAVDLFCLGQDEPHIIDVISFTILPAASGSVSLSVVCSAERNLFWLSRSFGRWDAAGSFWSEQFDERWNSTSVWRNYGDLPSWSDRGQGRLAMAHRGWTPLQTLQKSPQEGRIDHGGWWSVPSMSWRSS